jgi:glycosyltransferase involved in cell wall biosynthesis
MTAVRQVTVLMSVYDGARHLREAMDSILGQSFRDFEFLIVDDGSSDESSAIIASCADPRVVRIRNATNIGLTKSLNIGLAAARGDLVARQDADDRSYPDRLARQVAFLDAHPEIAVVGAQARIIDAAGRRLARDERKPLSAQSIRFALLFSNPIVHTSAMFRREPVVKLGGYDERFVTSQDVELWSRLAEQYPLANLAERLVDLRVHAQSVSATKYTRGNVRPIEDVLATNLRRFLGSDDVAPAWPEVWNAIVNVHAVEDIPETRQASAMVDAIRARFLEKRRVDRDVDRMYADVQLRIAEFLVTRERGPALRAAARAGRRCPSLALRRLPRLVAGALLGGSGLAALRTFARRLGPRAGRQ